jgi:hypothetical protein
MNGIHSHSSAISSAQGLSGIPCHRNISRRYIFSPALAHHCGMMTFRVVVKTAEGDRGRQVTEFLVGTMRHPSSTSHTSHRESETPGRARILIRGEVTVPTDL